MGGERWGPSQGRHHEARRSALAKHGWNLAPGQMGILSTRGGWNVAFVGGLLCIEGVVGCVCVCGGCLSRCQTQTAQVSVAERRICDVNTRGADENMNVKQGQ